jgi:hypothetical protein
MWDWRFVRYLQGECDWRARRGKSVCKRCEALEEGVIGGTFRLWPRFAFTPREVSIVLATRPEATRFSAG